MSLAEGQKALQTFNEWCDTQGIEYDREVRRVSRVFRDATHRRSRDGASQRPLAPTGCERAVSGPLDARASGHARARAGP